MNTTKETRTAHTPGPWETREIAHEATPFSERRVYRLEIVAPQYLMGKRTHSRDICQILDYCDWNDYPANARLIAAAPDLLAALEALYAVADPGHNKDNYAWQQARAAIAKAKGQA